MRTKNCPMEADKTCYRWRWQGCRAFAQGIERYNREIVRNRIDKAGHDASRRRRNTMLACVLRGSDRVSANHGPAIKRRRP